MYGFTHVANGAVEEDLGAMHLNDVVEFGPLIRRDGVGRQSVILLSNLCFWTSFLLLKVSYVLLEQSDHALNGFTLLLG